MEQITTNINKKIIITNQVAETNKYLRHLVKNKRTNLFNFEVKSLSEIAREVYFAYHSLYFPETRKMMINRNIQVIRLMSVLKAGKYDFLSEKSKDISSAKEILRVLSEIRMNEPSEYYLSSKDSRIAELRRIQSSYEKSLSDNNELDSCMLYENAIACLDKLNNLEVLMPGYIGADYIDMWYGDMTHIEKSFLEAFFKKINTNIQKVPMESSKENVPSYVFIKSYGVYNEVNFVKNEILDKNMQLGQVAIVYPTPEYESVLMAVLGNADISYTFPKGFSAKGTAYVQLMMSLLDFAKGDYDCKGLDAIIDNPAFILKDKRKQYRSFLKNRVGWKRKRYIDFLNSYEKEEDSTFIEFLEKVIACFDEAKSCYQIFHGMVKIANEYTDTRDIHRACLKDSLASQEKVFSLAVSDSFGESLKLIGDYLDTLKCKTAEQPSMVSLLPFGSDAMVDREVLFVLGLSNENIARTLVESPVLCDDDLMKCASNKVNLALEANKRRIEAFERMIQSTPAKKIYFSYSYYYTVSLLDCSPSLLYLEKLDQAGYKETDSKIVTYNIDSKAKKMDIASLSETSVEIEEDREIYKKEMQIPWVFSASSLQELLKCPLQYYYAHILHIPVVEHMDRMPDRWLPANKRGDIFHHTLENYINEVVIKNGSVSFEKDIFDKYFEAEVKKAGIENPVPSEVIFEEERDQAREISMKYIHSLLEDFSTSNKKIIGCEVDFENVSYKDKNFELVFRGSVDRLDGEIDEEGILQLDIIDYKTGRASHKLGEINDGIQIQHYVYPIAMLDWAAKHKEELEIRFGTVINGVAIRTVKYAFPYDEEKDEINVTNSVVESNFKLTEGITDVLSLTIGMLQQNKEQAMLQFAAAVATEKKNQDKDHCKYCQFKNICRG